MARRSRRGADAPDPEDYLADEETEYDDEEADERPRRRRRSRDEDDEEPPRRRRRARDDEDDEEEPPRRRRSRRDDDEEEDEPPRRRRSRRDDDEEDEEDERPRRRRSRRDDDEDEDEPPRRRRSRRDDDEDEEPPRRRKSRPRDDDEDDEPRSKKKRRGNRNAGWSGHDQVRSQASGYAARFSPQKVKGEVLIKFLEDDPFANYAVHWYDPPLPKGFNKRGWMCLISVGEEKCPGCDAGDRASIVTLFNVLVLDDDGDWNLQVLSAGTRLSGQIRTLAEGKGGLTEPYWSVVAGPSGSGTANFQKVKERDVEDDWDVEPLTDEELEDYEEELHVLDDVEQVPSVREFREFTRALED